jgi:PKD repeat protein
VSDPGGPYKGSVGAPVSFDGTGSSDPDGTFVSYAWDFGDGATGAGATLDHTYNSVGAYIVTLEVTDGDDTKASRFALAFIGAPNAEVTPVADVTGDGVNEAALASEGSVDVEVRDGSNGAQRSDTKWHDDPFRPAGIISMPDINGNGQAEIGALGVDEDTDTIKLRVADGATNQGIRNFAYFVAGHDAIDLAAVSDVSGNGAADVAVLASRRIDDRIIVKIADVLTGENALAGMGGRLVFLDAGFTPLGLAVLPNVLPSSSSDELVVFATRNSDGRGLVEIREADGTPGFTRIWFLDTSFTPKAIAIGDDADNNGIPEIAMLAERTADQRIVIERRNASGAPTTTRHWYFSEGWQVIDFTAVADTNDADNLPEYAVLAVRSDGKPAVEIRNAGDPKATFRRFFMDESFTALQVEDFGDTNGNGSTNIGVLGTRDSDDRPKLELRDVRGDSNTTTIWFAP